MSKKGRKDEDIQSEIGEIEKDLKKKFPFPQPERIRWQKGKKKFSKTAKYTSELTQKDEEGDLQELLITETESLLPVWSTNEREEYRYRERLMHYGLFEIIESLMGAKVIEMVKYLSQGMSEKEVAKRMEVTPSWINQWSKKVVKTLGKSKEFKGIPNVKRLLIEIVGGERRFNKLFPNWPEVSC